MARIERATSPLPRECSTTEPHGQSTLVWERRSQTTADTLQTDKHLTQTRRWSGRRDSNSRHFAWKAKALPTELLPRENLACKPRKTAGTLLKTSLKNERTVVEEAGFEPA